MTGIERLREFAKGCRLTGQRAYSNAINDIADQIEREQDEMVADSPYDAILPEDRDAIALVREHGGLEDVRAQLDVWQDVFSWAVELGGVETCHEAARWVREHGGLDYVMHEWQSRVPRDRYERRSQRLLDHIAECETALGRRNRRIEELGHRVSDLTTENAELRRRAMPEDKEWPRYKDGAPVNFDDTVVDAEGFELKVKSFEFHPNGFTLHGEFGESHWYEDDDRLDYPAPKVLDADGVEIRVGDTVWHVETGEQCKVIEVDSRSVSVDFCVDGDGTKHTGSVLPSNLTHRAPVLAADGRPLREGEHVYHVETGAELVVKWIPKPGEYQAVVVFAPPASHLTSFDPDQLTHEPPDSWERLEEDAKKDACDYFWRGKAAPCNGCPREHSDDCAVDMTIDLVRRAKKLAGVSDGD